MLAKPIARSEIFFNRVIGYLGIVWPYVILLGSLGGLVPGFGLAPLMTLFFRFADLGVWLAIVFATMMATLVYGMLFNALGVLWKYGIILATASFCCHGNLAWHSCQWVLRLDVATVLHNWMGTNDC